MHLETFTSETKKLWPRFKEFQGFVLGGGTALALYLGHRISEDFDFFSERELEPTLLFHAEKVFGKSAVSVVLNTSEQLTFMVDGVKVTFLTYRFGRHDAPVIYDGVWFMSIRDIAAAKAYALGRRATLKDYVDLFFIVSEKHCILTDIIKTASKTHGDVFDPRLFLEELVYLEDVPKEPIRFLKPPVSKEDIERFFEKEIQALDIERI